MSKEFEPFFAKPDKTIRADQHIEYWKRDMERRVDLLEVMVMAGNLVERIENIEKLMRGLMIKQARTMHIHSDGKIRPYPEDC